MTSGPPPSAVTVSVPATTANLGPGFDCLGLALDLRNELTLRFTGPFSAFDDAETTYTIHVLGVDAAKVPTDRRNLVVVAIESLFRHVNRRPTAAHLELVNCIPVGSGLGSSSSAVVAGLVGANALCDNVVSQDDIMRLAVALEGHPDNVTPAILGGLVLGILPDIAQGPERLIVRRWEPPALWAAVVLPNFRLMTTEARAVLPAEVTRADAIFNAGRLALLIDVLTTGAFAQLRPAMADRVHQQYRLNLIPGAAEAYEAAYAAGAQGVALSGAGPSLIALTQHDPQLIVKAMVDTFMTAGMESRSWILRPSSQGAQVTMGLS